ncbi:NADH-quinone oxidoreductase subunit N [Fundidesulfovibrio terrae]|uniref:NADH-quinone oxidoreductase subunit N n=1 Tax=Fundidesulfovibrio terrae TaxID=2922866 RepID=UPI001FAE820F|nr:NADH-quinone oxidoreductase subunit N [Fundidesulfovibrio terrae]
MKLTLFAPELFLLVGSLVLFLAGSFGASGRKARAITLAVALGGLVVCISSLHAQGMLFYDTYKVDLFSQMLKLAMTAGFAAVLLFGTELKGVADDVRPEYYLFLTLSTLGLLMLVSSVDLLTVFISLELSSYSLYLLVPMRDDHSGLRIQMESAIKYILFGVVATGVMLFGMSYVFGLTGTTFLAAAVPALHAMQFSPAAVIAVALTMGGFFFKLAVFPFHFWAPDVYQGASNETTAFIASVPKVAAVALLIRIAMMTPSDSHAVVSLLALLSVCSMFYGNLVALVQTDFKRMLGFSGIAHAGYVLLGIVTLRESGYAMAVYYIIGYLAMTVAGFMVACKVSKNGENVSIADLGGLYKRSPLLAFTLAVSMFGMAGIPPFVGFMSKFLLLTEAYNAGLLWLVVLAAINTAISIYYYLSVVRVTYTSEAEDPSLLHVDGATKAVSVILVAIIIALGLLPDTVVKVASEAVKTLL